MSIDHGFPVDQVYHGDSRDMKEVPDDTVSLVVCSPPYNVRKPYGNHDDNMPLDEYRELLLAVWSECKRVLRPGGRLCVNVAGVWRQPYLPLHAVIWHQLVEELHLLMRGEIIWDKGASVGVSTAWGSFASPSNPTLRDVHEHVLVAAKGPTDFSIAHNTISIFSKDALQLPPNQLGAPPDIDNDDFVDWTRSVWRIAPDPADCPSETAQLPGSVWRIPTESSSRVGHPAPFPVDLPRRLILLYTFPGDTVLDPFCGSGSTCVAAVETDRRYIGYDIDIDYVQTARERAREASRRTGTLQQKLIQLPSAGRRRRRRMAKGRTVLKFDATALVGEGDVRDREVRVGIQDGEVLISIKTLGTPDRQKQNVAASLPVSDAQRLATALLKAAESVQTRE